MPSLCCSDRQYGLQRDDGGHLAGAPAVTRSLQFGLRTYLQPRPRRCARARLQGPEEIDALLSSYELIIYFYFYVM